jgi:putative membrane protein
VLANLSLYIAFLVTAVLLLGLFVAAYVAITPYHEFSLIRAGNTAAAWSLGGVVIGLASQLVVFFLVSLLLKGLKAGIEADRASYGMTSAAFSVSVGILNAGSLTT